MPVAEVVTLAECPPRLRVGAEHRPVDPVVDDAMRTPTKRRHPVETVGLQSPREKDGEPDPPIRQPREGIAGGPRRANAVDDVDGSDERGRGGESDVAPR